MNEVEKLLREDAVDKRKAGSGIFHRTGKRGYVGKMVMPSDYIDRRKEKDYRSGKVDSYMLDERDINAVKSKEEIEKMENPAEYLSRIVPLYKQAVLIRHWGINSYAMLYKFLKKYDVDYYKYKHPGNVKSGKKNPADGIPVYTPVHQSNSAELVVFGEFECEALKSKLLAAGMFCTDGMKYKVELKITEVK